MKRQILSAAAVSLLAIFGMVFSSMPAHAVSFPPVYFATAKSCALPDGSTGVISSDDNRTCCPSSAIGPNGNADPIKCLYAKYINPAINLLASLVGIVVVIAIVYGAIEYITSAGDPQRANAGRKRIIEALIGLAAFFLLYAFLQFLVPGGFFNG